jgi:hypothetical protein
VRKALFLFVLIGAAAAVSLLGQRPPAAPAQPVEFSHRIHAGENQLACSYCHTGVARSAVAGVPSVATCYECHRGVKLRNDEITKVLNAWEAKQPIRWTRVHLLADHVYFSHERHTAAGVACEECHGNIASMDRVARVSDLTMGWCVTCHEERNAPLECSTCHK